ncbi:phage tail tube protein [Microbacterium dauci]|uniref:IPT/TIG domain-containing protein n=1 Tax=Microbacterium dauci TaxID=3048008 RepID=A0ABT6ZC65_9MICO|nr:IPT/TIG domain-containing protein [Microbacterium sp. LX3-4]MDJ1113237.1 IPT/TIG domain-containing protein [Microbacterium sp. LX3-4]
MTNPVSLPAGATLGKSFEHGLDVNLGTYGAPVWQPIRRISGWAPTYPPVTTDVATYDDLGSPNEDVSGRGFATAFTVQGNRLLSTGLYLPELEKILAAAKAKGEGAILDVRWYHKPENGTPNPNDAGRAYVRVEASRQNTGNAENEVYSVTLTGKGSFEPIANPFTGWGETIPVLSSVTPPTAGDGEMVTITGAGFLGATAVTVDGDPVPEFVVVNASTIIATLPTGDAGAVPVIVTTPAGPSTALVYTRGA